ncbi:MAG: DUF6090 family protein [Flavobacteriales bacterium]|nr:DUF6090 family protein [Flavobacteriales bacterium]
MIKFFRRIRHRLLSENKFGRYVIYGIGEIVLVVIGILIALYINNWNEERKSIAETEHLLTQIHRELAFNIDQANDVSRFYRQRDSLVYNVLHKKVTYNDYIPNRLYSGLLQGIPLANLKDNAFRNLTNHESQLTQQQDSLYDKLIDLYEKNKNRLDISDENAIMRLQKHAQKLKDEKPWYYNYHVKNELTDEMIDYFLNDPIYLNEVTHYGRTNIGGHNTVALNFRNKALKLYNELSDYLNIPKDTLISTDLSRYEHIIGTYSDSLNIVEIIKEKERFIYIRKHKTDSVEVVRAILYPETKDNFTVGGSFGHLTFINNKVDRIVLSSGSNRLSLKRIN